MILKLAIRFLFIEQAIETLSEKLHWNLIVAPQLKRYPKTYAGMMQAIEETTFLNIHGRPIEKDTIFAFLRAYGVQKTIEVTEELIRSGGKGPLI